MSISLTFWFDTASNATHICGEHRRDYFQIPAGENFHNISSVDLKEAGRGFLHQNQDRSYRIEENATAECLPS